MTDYEFNMRDNEEEFEKEFVDDYSVVSPHEPPTLEDTSWDADSAEASLRRWAGGPDKDDINWTDYRKGFLYYDSGNIEQWGSYYFPHHKVQDGELVTSERGVITAGNYLQGARGFNPDQLPDEVLSRARSHLARHYAQFDRTPPWRETDEEETEQSELIGAGKYRCPSCGAFLKSPKMDMCNNCGEEFDPFEAINPIRLEASGESEIKIVKHWKRGELIKKDEKVVHYDIFFDDKQFVASSNPLDEDVVCSSRKPYKENFIEEIDREIKFINKNEVAAINNNESWMKTVYSNEGKVLEGDNCYALTLEEDIICLLEDDERDNIWKARKLDLEECCEFSSEYKFQEINKENMLLSMNSAPIEASSVEFQDDEAVVSGLIISEGSWNGVWFSEEVLQELSEEELQDISIDVGTHDDKEEDVGEIIDIQWHDEMKGWYFEVRIEDEDALDRLEEMENPGFSIETDIYVDRERNKVEEVASISSAVLVPNPACKVCYVDEE